MANQQRNVANVEGRHRSWCFTDNECLADVWASAPCKYIVYGVETAPTTGQRHFQGFIMFQHAKSFAAVKLVHPRCHWEVARNVRASIEYSKKDGVVTERGTPPAQGKRTDFEDVYELIKDGGSYEDILEVNPGIAIKNVQGVKAAIASQVQHRSQDVAPQVHWFWGPTGSGKSREAFLQAGEDAYVWCSTGKFWEGYMGQKNVIMDDFRPDQINFALLLKILDRYRMTVEVKGGSCKLAATNFWITTPQDPRSTYTGRNHITGQTWERENIDQLVRRCTEVRQFGAVQLYPIFNNEQ